MPAMPAPEPPTMRGRYRAQVRGEVKQAALSQLAESGPAGLSVSAIGKQLGVSGPALYRYFASRDELLTALIIEGYDALGEAVEQADAACAREDYPARWRAAAGAARDWALAHPHEYALLYGSPVPGYQAPADTIAPAARSAAVFGRLVSQAQAAGVLRPLPAGPSLPPTLTGDLDQLRADLMPGVPDEVVAAALTVWAAVFGIISFELFGQFNNVIADRDAYFGRALADLARLFGLPI